MKFNKFKLIHIWIWVIHYIFFSKIYSFILIKFKFKLLFNIRMHHLYEHILVSFLTYQDSERIFLPVGSHKAVQSNGRETHLRLIRGGWWRLPSSPQKISNTYHSWTLNLWFLDGLRKDGVTTFVRLRRNRKIIILNFNQSYIISY